MKQFIVHIDENADVSIDVPEGKRYGKKCTDLTKFLEEALGEVTSRKFNKDYSAPQDKNVVIQLS